MINLEANIRTLEHCPLLLLDNGSRVATLFLDEVRKRMKTATIDLAAVSIQEVCAEVRSLDADVLPIFLVPKKITDMEIGNLVHFMLKREEYGGIDFEQMRYLVVAKGESIDAIDSEYRPVSFGVICYIPEMFKKLHTIGHFTIGMVDSGAVNAYRFTGMDWEEAESVFAVLVEIAEMTGFERNWNWDKRQFYQQLFRHLELREYKLQAQFNGFWNNIFQTSQDLYSKLDSAQWLELKNALSNVNNIITLKATQKFLERLEADGVLMELDARRLWRKVNEQNANTNGFDVHNEKLKIAAEVKCNIPVDFGKFGAAQIDNIEKDIRGLVNGKQSEGVFDMDDYRKFFVMLCSKDGSQRLAMRSVKKHLASEISLVEYKGQCSIVQDNAKTVYVVYIDF